MQMAVSLVLADSKAKIWNGVGEFRVRDRAVCYSPGTIIFVEIGDRKVCRHMLSVLRLTTYVSRPLLW